MTLRAAKARERVAKRAKRVRALTGGEGEVAEVRQASVLRVRPTGLEWTLLERSLSGVIRKLGR